MNGKKVTVVEMQKDILMNGARFVANEQNIRYLVENSGVEILCNTGLTEVLDDGVLVKKDGEIVKIECDSVVFSAGFRANQELFNAVKTAGFECVQIGDNAKVGKIIDATHQAYHYIRVLE